MPKPKKVVVQTSHVSSRSSLSLAKVCPYFEKPYRIEPMPRKYRRCLPTTRFAFSKATVGPESWPPLTTTTPTVSGWVEQRGIPLCLKMQANIRKMCWLCCSIWSVCIWVLGHAVLWPASLLNLLELAFTLVLLQVFKRCWSWWWVFNREETQLQGNVKSMK